VDTRLVWVLLFAVAVGLLVLFSLRSIQPGTAAGRLVARMAAAQESLARRYPDSGFRLQLVRPAPGVTNLVVTVRPPHADSTLVAALIEDMELVVRQYLDPDRFDTLVLAVAGKVVRTVPARASPAR